MLSVSKNKHDGLEFTKGVLRIPGSDGYTDSHLNTFLDAVGAKNKYFSSELQKDTHVINETNVNFKLPIIYNAELVSNIIDDYLLSIGKTYSYFPGKEEIVIEKFKIDIKTDDDYTCYLLNIQINIGLLKSDLLKNLYNVYEKLHLY